MRASSLAVCVSLCSIFLSSFPVPNVRAAEQAAAPGNAACLGCHGTVGIAAPRADKSIRSLSVDGDRFSSSVHGKGLQCVDCHAAMAEIPHKDVSATLAEWRRKIPDVCAGCHAKQRGEYAASAHGKAVTAGSSATAAVCSDCHSAHGIARPKTEAARVASVKACASCHEKELKSYKITSHGKIATLGYGRTATCSDCHGGHAIVSASDRSSRTHAANVLKTCRECHADATAGFATFQPHATTDDFARYPQM